VFCGIGDDSSRDFISTDVDSVLGERKSGSSAEMLMWLTHFHINRDARITSKYIDHL
jgi:hypothetical protein